jgi:TonB family protein
MSAFLYRPGPKRPIFVAFAAAAAIHISALAFSSNPRPDLVITDEGPPDIIGENAAPEITPEPEQQEVKIDSNVPPPVVDNEFYDDVRPTPHPIAKPIRSTQMASAPRGRPGNGKLFAISAPRPNYPYEARSHNITGSGAVMLDVDPLTGTVINARVTETTGRPILDNSALSAFRRWRFKNRTPSAVKIPFTFTMFGAQI